MEIARLLFPGGPGRTRSNRSTSYVSLATGDATSPLETIIHWENSRVRVTTGRNFPSSACATFPETREQRSVTHTRGKDAWKMSGGDKGTERKREGKRERESERERGQTRGKRSAIRDARSRSIDGVAYRKIGGRRTWRACRCPA